MTTKMRKKSIFWLTAALAYAVSAAPSLHGSMDMMNIPKPKEPDGNGGGKVERSGRPFGRDSGHLTCHVCERGQCNENRAHVTPAPSMFCGNAVKCYTARVRDADGAEHQSRGCISSVVQMAFYCSGRKYNGKRGQYAIDCCNESLCNDHAVLPELPRAGRAMWRE